MLSYVKSFFWFGSGSVHGPPDLTMHKHRLGMIDTQYDVTHNLYAKDIQLLKSQDPEKE